MKKLIILTILLLKLKPCPNADERCGSCQNTQCEFCYDSYISSTGKCLDPIQKTNHCLTYNSDGKSCKQCVFNYSLIDKECIKIEDPNCLRVDSENKCLACKDKMTINSGICTSEKKCSLENCSYCGFDNGGKEICIFCDSGYSIFPVDVSDQCKSTGISGCLSLNFYDEKQCSLCKAGYYFSDGECKGTSVYSLEMAGVNLFSLFFGLFYVFGF